MRGRSVFFTFFFLFNVNKCNLFINIALLVKFFAICILVKISQSDWLLLAIDSKHGEKSCRICLVKFRKHKRKGRRKKKQNESRFLQTLSIMFMVPSHNCYHNTENNIFHCELIRTKTHVLCKYFSNVFFFFNFHKQET